jgi:hypothetical protein
MKRVKWLAVAIAGFFLISGPYAWRWLSCFDRKVSFYPTQAAALADGAIDRGWVPGTLPISASGIHEEHDLDTNEVWMRFTVPLADAQQFVSPLRLLSWGEAAALTMRSPCDDGWWFGGLIQAQPANDGALYADVYSGSLPGQPSKVIVAIEQGSSTVYYWSHEFSPSGQDSNEAR